MSAEMLCQTCGNLPKPEMRMQGTDLMYPWLYHDFSFPEGHLQIWTCRKCANEFSLPEIFELYKERIRTGANNLYH